MEKCTIHRIKMRTETNNQSLKAIVAGLKLMVTVVESVRAFGKLPTEIKPCGEEPSELKTKAEINNDRLSTSDVKGSQKLTEPLSDLDQPMIEKKRCGEETSELKTQAVTNYEWLSTCDVKGIQKLTVRLSDLKDFGQAMIEKNRCGNRRSELTVHVTPLNSQDVEPLYNDLGWYNYLLLFAMTWIFAEHGRAFRIHTYFGYSNLQDETPSEKIYTADFIEFGDKAKTPQSLIKLSKCLKKLEGSMFSTAVYETLNQNFPNYVSKKKLKGSESFWIQFESNFEPTIEFSKTKPTWLDSGIDLKVDSVDAPSEWMNDIIWCFTFLAKMYPEFGIVLKQVENEDTKLIFFIRRGNLSHFSIFLGTFNNFPKEIPKESTSVAVAKAALGFVPIVGSCMTIKDSIDAFKTGNPKTGWCCLALGSVGLVADAFLVGGPLVSLTAKVASRSTKVVSTCAKITEATATATKVSRYSKNVITIGQEVAHRKALTSSTAEPAGLETVSDLGLLKIVFPRLAEDILSEPC